MANEKKYSAVFALQDKVTEPLKKIKSAFSKFSEKTEIAKNKLNTLPKSFQKAGNEAENASRKMEAAAGKTNKLPQMFIKMGKKADSLKKKEQALGTTASMLAMRHNLVGKSFLRADSNLAKLDRRLGKTKGELEYLGSRTKNLKAAAQGITDFGKKMTVGVTLPIFGLGTAMVKSAADMEAAQMQLSTLLGSEEKGAKMFDEIKTMAAKTPFGTKDLIQASNTMLGFGINADKILPYMQQLGDISGGNAERFQSLALAFSQVSSAGKLQGQDLMQMINAGFNPLEAMAKRTGKSIGQLKEEMSKGKITIQMVTQAMEDATSEGGRFYKMMDKQSKTALGQLSTLLDDLNMTLAEFGKIIIPYCIKGLQKLSAALQWFKELSPAAKKTILILAGLAAAVGPLISILGSLTSAIGAVVVACSVLAAHPVVAAIAAAIAAIIAIIAIIKNWKTVVKMIGKTIDWLTSTPLGKLISCLFPVIGAIALIAKNWDKAKSAITQFVSTAVAKIQELWTKLEPIIKKITAGLQFAFNLTPAGMAINGVKYVSEKLGSNGGNYNRQSFTNNSTTNTTTNHYYYGNNNFSGSSIEKLNNAGMNFALQA